MLSRAAFFALLAHTCCALARPHGGGRCVDEVDCNLNGACASGACSCVPPWTGADCGALDFERARAPDGALYRRENISSWCASALRDDAGVWHAVVAQMADNCGLNSWEQNSQLVHVTSTAGPEGPYSGETVIRLPFSHNPKLARAPDGTYIIWHIGCGDNTTHRMGNCSGGVSPPPPPTPPVHFSNGGRCMGPLNNSFPAWQSPVGGLSPLILSSCMDEASQWRLEGNGAVTSVEWPSAFLNIDCDACNNGAGVKMLTHMGEAAGKATGGLLFSPNNGGELQVVGCTGMCVSNGGTGASKPCGSGAEPWTPTQLHVVSCASPDASGWSVSAAAAAASSSPAKSAPLCGISYTELLTSPSLDGPWSFQTAFGPNATGDHPFFPASVDNPAPFFWPNGSVGVMFRSYTRASAEFHSSIGIARAPDWRGPWELPSEPIFAGLQEDPFWWYQPSTDSYHALFHNMGGCSAVGCHAFSRDGFSWTLSPTPAYDYNVTFTDGTTTVFSRRERPQLVFDPDTGAPTHLINGVQLPRAQQPAHSQGDNTYSIIVPLRV